MLAESDGHSTRDYVHVSPADKRRASGGKKTARENFRLRPNLWVRLEQIGLRMCFCGADWRDCDYREIRGIWVGSVTQSQGIYRRRSTDLDSDNRIVERSRLF